MKYTVETWSPEFGASVQSLDLESTLEPTNLEVEFTLDNWKPIDPRITSDEVSEITFVDGVRRIDARIWISADNDLPSPGICATVAAGTVVTSPTAATCQNIRVERYFLTVAQNAQSIRTEYGEYTLISLSDSSPEESMGRIANAMLNLEKKVSENIESDKLIINDGPLRGRKKLHAVGMIKTHHKMYLQGSAKDVVMTMDTGQRTPIFEILGLYPRYAWYLQLPIKKTHPLAGVVRCEISSARTISEAGEFANKVSRSLPKFASEPHKDTRAPQNLYPIAGLERELKRRLGDQRLLERSLRRASFLP